MPSLAQPVAFGDQRIPVCMRQHLVDDGVIIAAVVARAARDQIGKFVAADEVALAHFEPVDPAGLRDLSIIVSMA